MVDKESNKGKQRLRYNLEQRKKICSYYIINHISEHATLVQFMDSLGNLNHAVIVVGN